TIVNDDPAPTMSVAGVSQNEGNSGTTPFVFTVTLSNPSDQPVTVSFNTADGTALLSDNDYQSTSGTLTFAPGQTSQTVTVNVLGDVTPDLNETSTPTPAANALSLHDALPTGTIVNDDGAPTMSVGGVSQNEGNSGTTPFVFTVTLSNPSSQQVTVSFN